MKLYALIVTLVAIAANQVQSANILVVNPMPSFSHFVVPFTIAKELANRGHHVASISSYPQNIKGIKIRKYLDVPVTENIALMEDVKKKLFERHSGGILESLTNLFDMTAAITNNTVHHKHVQRILESEVTFDAVVIEHFFNEALVGFGHRFKAPVIFVSTQAASAMNNYIFGNPSELSYIPGTSMTFTKHMSFWERIQNLAMSAFFNILIHFYHLPLQEKIFKSYISDDIQLADVLYNTSLMLTNSHVSFYDAIPHVPNIIEVGGVHVAPKALPEDLQKYLDDAKDGVVLFSMGSNLRSEDLKPETKDGILKAFSKLKQKVLWKFETDLPNAPENVKISHWFPQQDILAHPNVRAFITHGGRLSTIEAVHFGVPLIGIPVFGDQISNIAAAVDNGYALRINLDELSEDTLSAALNEILTNPRYKENIQQRSKLIHDQPLKPLDSAVYWIEHVIRHQGAPHLRSAGADLKWYQRESLDVIGFLLLVFCTMVTLSYLTIRKLCRCLFRRKVVRTTKSKIKKQ